MKKYERPMMLVNEELTEGVYAASGTTVIGENSDCYNLSDHQFQDHGAYFYAATNFQHQPVWEESHKSLNPVITFYFSPKVNVLGLVADNVSARITSETQGVSTVTVQIDGEIDVYGSLGSVALKIEKTGEEISFTGAIISCS